MLFCSFIVFACKSENETVWCFWLSKSFSTLRRVCYFFFFKSDKFIPVDPPKYAEVDPRFNSFDSGYQFGSSSPVSNGGMSVGRYVAFTKLKH